jgi:hypothetical protein
MNEFTTPGNESLYTSLMDNYVPDWLKTNKPLRLDRFQTINNYGLSPDNIPEIRALTLPYTDPLYLNFKLMINTTKSYGLFADAENKNSAEWYLINTDDEARANLLKVWKTHFLTYLKEFEFLVMGCEGLGEIFNHKQGDIYTDSDKINFNIRETIDMKFQSLLTMYRQIWFDDTRGVEVLPINLRRFDIIILLYSAGYYYAPLYEANMSEQVKNATAKTYDTALGEKIDKFSFNDVVPDKYKPDVSGDDLDNPIFTVLPTIGKIMRLEQHKTKVEKYDMNAMMFYIADCSIDMENSGKDFFGSIMNDNTSEMVKNNLSLNFRFAYVNGSFNNIFGKLNIPTMLAIIDATDKKNNKNFGKTMANFGKQIVSSAVDMGDQLLDELKSKPAKYIDALIGPNSYLGNALNTMTDPSYLPKMVKSFVDLGISKIEDKFIYSNIANLQDFLKNNFSFTFLDMYNNYMIHNVNEGNTVKYQENSELSSFNKINPENYKNSMDNGTSYTADQLKPTITERYMESIENEVPGSGINTNLIVNPNITFDDNNDQINNNIELDMGMKQDSILIEKQSIFNRKTF